ncbi:hypothetical protein BT69DRAFT_1358988 [Atractiella rhizophila]|nr:hypothetical protein BT69DRAFT_1358988 [Atractiella rhizophila]
MDWKGLAQGEITPPFKPSVDPDDENLDRSSVTADISESQYKSRRSSVIDSGFGGSDRRSSERNPFSKHVQGLFRGFTFARETSAENGSALLRPGLRRNSESRAADFEHKRRTLQRKGSSFDETLAHKNLPLTSSIPSFDDFDGSWGSFDDD